MRILLIDSHTDLVVTLRAGLTREGWAVDTAADGVIGQLMAQHNHYDVIVLDIVLPGRNGYDVLDNLRGLGIQTPVMVISAKDGDHDQTDAFGRGADDYLVKPFHFRVLEARLHALLRRATPQGTSLMVGDLLLDPHARFASRAGTPLELTGLEFRLLHHLMSHPGQVLAKKDILTAVWGEDYLGPENIVEVYIGYLRRKIDLPFHVRSIVTIRRQGYQLLARHSRPQTPHPVDPSTPSYDHPR